MFAFRSMNTEVTVTAEDPHEEAIAGHVAAVFWRAERRFSRFRADSELAKLNMSQGPLVVSPKLFDALRRARRYVEMTDGLFDPGVGADLIALGYDRSFAPGALDRERIASVPRAGRFLDLILDPSTLTVERPSRLWIDLGGMIKGATVDAAARCLRTSGTIDAGGDADLGSWRSRTRSILRGCWRPLRLPIAGSRPALPTADAGVSATPSPIT
jgi:thiamine biosynthesis lipoprotein